ncbi:MAG: NAD(P)-dependent oxidoreductase [Chloroflexi bacterium]|nr:MAG: NAD(P)-dependent oxidoreductase [Chloroflexota bacterium]
MKVLVTGNLGYIGPVLAAALTRAGHEVHGLDRALFVRYATQPLPAIARQTIGDIRDERTLREAIERCDAVIQLAAMSNDPLGELDGQVTTSVNLDATLRVIELAGDRPLILYSSASVYGMSSTVCGEDAPVRPLTLYSVLKVAAEDVALRQSGALVLRNGTVHGPAPVIRGDLLLNSMVASAVAIGEIVLMTTGATMRPVVDIRDLAELTVGLLERGVTGLYNAAASNIAVGEAAQLVAGITGATVVERHHGADPRNYAMDTSRLEAIAGWWRPRPLASSVRDLIDHYREIGLTARDITTQRYHRITQYRARIATVEAGAAK